MTYAELKAALGIFGYTALDRPTRAQIKRRHRELIRAHHPDLQGEDASPRMQRINAAAAILTEYIQSYHFSFSEEEFYRQNPEEQLRVQFADAWGKV